MAYWSKGVVTSLDGIKGLSIQTLLRGENDSKQSDENSGHIWFFWMKILFAVCMPHVHVNTLSYVLLFYPFMNTVEPPVSDPNCKDFRVAYGSWSLARIEPQGGKKSFNFRAKKVVAAAYGRWSFTRGSSCKALTEEVLVFWIGGRLCEVVADERWSHMEVRLYLLY